MAIPSTKATLKSYCLRSLGDGVIDINVSDDQVDDRLDEALQYFAQYHYDGIERVYLKHKITQTELDRGITNTTTSVTDKIDSDISADWLEGKGFIPVPDTIVSVVKVFPLTDTGGGGSLFDVRYQLRLNDLYDFSSTSVMHYQQTMQHLDFLEHILVGETPIRFNQHQNRLYLDMDWTNNMTVDEYLIIECYRKLDPTSYTDIYDDIYLKRYATSLIKKQWGTNLTKFQGVKLPGGIELNGRQIYEDALRELAELRQRMSTDYELPPLDLIG